MQNKLLFESKPTFLIVKNYNLSFKNNNSYNNSIETEIKTLEIQGFK